MKLHRPAALGAALTLLLSAAALRADVKLPAIFGDHMVLQEDMKLPVWGTADPGEAVTVTVGTETEKATAGADGKWRVDLAPLPANAMPVTVTVAGKNSVSLNDVLVGEVWLCSGQSNMELPMTRGGVEDLPQASDPQIRLFLVKKNASLDPVGDVEGEWELCTPDTVKGFSAAGYFFGRDLRKTLKRPVGLIGSYWGGTPAQAWTSYSALKAVPALADYVQAADKTRADEPAAAAAYPAKLAAYKAELADWEQNGGKGYGEALKAWMDAVAAAPAAPHPPRPVPASPMPMAPNTPEGGSKGPANLYNGMIAPLIPFAIKGAIWYQGEANSGRGYEYATLFPTMIKDWRARWGEGDFPFIYVQLAAFKAGTNKAWAFLREAQLQTLALPNTGMATAVDIGNPTNIHPTDKKDVGHRLALIALHLAYGEKSLPDSGPIYDAMKVSGNKAVLTFTQTNGGLVIGKAPWVAPGFPPIPATKLVGFVISGADKKWFPAEARIQGNAVVVSSPSVPSPVAVRYDWDDAPRGNLYNKANLPASPFRTDDWVETDGGPVVAGATP